MAIVRIRVITVAIIVILEIMVAIIIWQSYISLIRFDCFHYPRGRPGSRRQRSKVLHLFLRHHRNIYIYICIYVVHEGMEILYGLSGKFPLPISSPKVSTLRLGRNPIAGEINILGKILAMISLNSEYPP